MPDELERRLAAAAAALPPIVCFANDWRGDPTSKHHIMRNLSRHVPVLWVESSGMRRPNLSSAADLKRIAQRLRLAVTPAAPRRQDPEPDDAGAIRVISPLSVPLPGNRVAERITRAVYRRAVTRAAVSDALPLLWVYTPTVAPYLDAIPHRGVVYHCVDRWWAFSEYDQAVMRRCHEDLCRRADVVFASAVQLLDDCRAFAPDARLMPHGVDWDHFSRAVLDPPARPADISDIEHPIIGFFGLLHDWIDQDLLAGVADALPGATLVLIGKARVDMAALIARPNIRWLGQKPFSQLPAYAAAFDAALVPFTRNELTAAVNPIKLLEYLSAGVPVVATDLPEIVRLRERRGLHVAGTTRAFIEQVGALVQQPVTPAARIEIAMAQRADSWLGRCASMAEQVVSAMAGSMTP